MREEAHFFDLVWPPLVTGRVKRMGSQLGSGTDSPCEGGLRPYVHRGPEDGALHHVAREHAESFLAETKARSDGEGLVLSPEGHGSAGADRAAALQTTL